MTKTSHAVKSSVVITSEDFSFFIASLKNDVELLKRRLEAIEQKFVDLKIFNPRI